MFVCNGCRLVDTAWHEGKLPHDHPVLALLLRWPAKQRGFSWDWHCTDVCEQWVPIGRRSLARPPILQALVCMLQGGWTMRP